MASRRIEEQLEALAACVREARTRRSQLLRRGLTDRSNVVVAKAAKVVGELDLRDAIPDLLAAFERLFDDPVKRDSQCWGKTASRKRCATWTTPSGAPFLRGARWVQYEPVWGGAGRSRGAPARPLSPRPARMRRSAPRDGNALSGRRARGE